jgi:D-alanyl-lipoteichoic acid acyltransferase DltB (MBOAT superfamily)
VFLVLSGLFKKVAVADALAPYVAIRFASPAQCTGPDLVLALLCYSVEIYCDFSGYSDIARGSGKLMGFELPVNFRQPYLSRSITEFWQRWHISLSSWFRDYLFLPLDYAFLRRVPELQMLGLSEEYWGYVFSTTLTMAICGAWHGSQLTFVVWGAAHGALLAGHRVLLRFRKPSRRRGPWPGTTLMSLGKGIGCFLLVTVLWIPFRSPDFQSAREFLTGIVGWRSGGSIEVASIAGVGRFAILAGFVGYLDVAQRWTGDEVFLLREPWVVRGLVYAAFALTLLVLGSINAETPFIYFQF